MDLDLCISSENALYIYTKFRENILKGFKFLSSYYFQMEIFNEGIIP